MPQAAQTEVEQQENGEQDESLLAGNGDAEGEGAAGGAGGGEGEGQEGAQGAGGADEGSEGAGEAGEQGAAAGEIDITFGGEPTEEEDENRAPVWVRELRKSNRDKDRRIRELEQQVAAATPAPQAVVVGTKPTMESCDFDADRYERELEEWHTRKRDADEQERSRTQAQEQERVQWQTRVDAVNRAGAALKIGDYEEANEAFEAQFSTVQRGIIVGAPNDPKTSAQLRYALGKNPKKAKELAAIQDPVKFTYELGQLVKDMKVTARKPAPAPDRVVRSSVPGAAAVDSELKRLQEQADKTGDRTKVAAYLRDQARKRAA